MTTSDTVLTNRPTMGGTTIRIVSIEPPWFEERAQVQSYAWRELNRGHIPQEIVDAVIPEFALKLTRSHAEDPNQVVLVALEDNHVIGSAELLQTSCSSIKRSEAAGLASLYVLESYHRHDVDYALVEVGQRTINSDRLALRVVGFNTNAQGSYRHIGFHETSLIQTEDMGPELGVINYSDSVFQQTARPPTRVRRYHEAMSLNSEQRAATIREFQENISRLGLTAERRQGF